MQSHAPDATASPRRSRATLWLILAVCAAPIAASYLAYHFWRPDGQVNYGELIEPRPLPDPALERVGGGTFRFSELRGSWVLLTAAPATCGEACVRDLVYMRQVRLAQGKDSARVERVWLVTGGGSPDPALQAQHEGLHAVRGSEAILSALPASAGDPIYVVDPLGNLMMRFPPDPDPRRMLKDLSRLLRHNKWK